MIIIFSGIRSGVFSRFFPSRPQHAIRGTGILGQTASFERRLRGAAQTPFSPCRIRSAPGRDRGTWAERGKREVKCVNFSILGGMRPSYFWILAYICRA